MATEISVPKIRSFSPDRSNQRLVRALIFSFFFHAVGLPLIFALLSKSRETPPEPHYITAIIESPPAGEPRSPVKLVPAVNAPPIPESSPAASPKTKAGVRQSRKPAAAVPVVEPLPGYPVKDPAVKTLTVEQAGKVWQSLSDEEKLVESPAVASPFSDLRQDVTRTLISEAVKAQFYCENLLNSNKGDQELQYHTDEQFLNDLEEKLERSNCKAIAEGQDPFERIINKMKIVNQAFEIREEAVIAKEMASEVENQIWALSSSNQDMRETAGWVLMYDVETADYKNYKILIPLLLKGLNSDAVYARRKISEALAYLTGKGMSKKIKIPMVDPLLAALEKEDDPAARENLIRALDNLVKSKNLPPEIKTKIFPALLLE